MNVVRAIGALHDQVHATRFEIPPQYDPPNTAEIAASQRVAEFSMSEPKRNQASRRNVYYQKFTE